MALVAAHGVTVVPLEESGDFSLFIGGPLFQLLRRAHLSGSALELVRSRVIVIVAVVWVPLLLLSLAGATPAGTGPVVPFLQDVEANVRFLIALPLLIVAELVVHGRMRLVIRQFLDRNLIPPRELPRFEAAVASAYRMRNSAAAELALIAFVYLVGILFFWRDYVAFSTTTWYASPGPGGLGLTPAGFWYACVSLPAFQFLLVRWYYRIFIWSRFLWQVSRIPLSLIPTHPDRVGGLGFLSNIAHAFTPIAVAHGAMAAGPIANRILHLGATLPEFKAEIAFVVAFAMLLVFGPLLVFVFRLAPAKRVGLREYGTLAERYVREFDAKWLRGGAPADEPLVGSGDIQSLADLDSSFEIVRTMRAVPITRDALMTVVGATLAPIVPLLLTMMSLEDLLKKLFGILL
jgi:hypothetical protein